MPSMAGGGSQRVVLNILNNLDKTKFDIFLVLIKKEGPYVQYLANHVKLIDLNISIASDVFLGIGSTVIKSIDKAGKYFGYPAKEMNRKNLREFLK